jgi:hypothetical protein
VPAHVSVVYVLLFAVGFGIYGYLWPQAPVVVSDSRGYLQVAQDLADLAIDRLHDRTPGYPLLLRLTGATETPTRLLFYLSLSLHFASIWLLASVLHRAGVAEKLLHLFGLLLLLPPYVEPAGYVLTENLAEFVLTLALTSLVFWCLSHRLLWLILAALAIGYSGLTRPGYQALAPALCACLLMTSWLFRPARLAYSDALKAGLIVTGASAIILGGYAYMNYVRFGYFGLSPLLGFHMSTKNARFVEQLPDEYSTARETIIKYRNTHLVARDSSHTGYAAIWEARPELARVTGLGAAELATYMLRLNLMLIREAPLEYLAEVARVSTTYWWPAAGNLANRNSTLAHAVWAVVHFCVLGLFFLQTVMFVGTGMWLIAKPLTTGHARPRGIVPGLTPAQVVSYALAGTIVLYTMLITCLVDIGDPRQRRPTDGLILLMVFVGAQVVRCPGGGSRALAKE